MTVEITTLGLGVDARQPKEAAPVLDKLAAAAGSAEQSSKKLEEQSKSTASAIGEVGKAAKETAADLDEQRRKEQAYWEERRRNAEEFAKLSTGGGGGGDFTGHKIPGLGGGGGPPPDIADGAAASMGKYAAAIGIAVEATHRIVDAVVELVKAYAEWEEGQDRLNAMLAIAGQSVGKTSEEINQLIVSIRMAGESSESSLLKASTALLKFSGITGTTFDKALRLSDDLAAVLGTDVSQAAETVGRALENSYGASMLRRMGLITDAQMEYLKALKEVAGEQAYQNELLGILEDKVGGVAERMAKDGLSGAWTQLTNEIAHDAREITGWLVKATDVERLLRELTETLVDLRTKGLSQTIFSPEELEVMRKAAEWLTKIAQVAEKIQNLDPTHSRVMAPFRQIEQAASDRMSDADTVAARDAFLRSEATERARQEKQAKDELLKVQTAALDLIKKSNAAYDSSIAKSKSLKENEDDLRKALLSNNDARELAVKKFGSLDKAVTELAKSITKIPKAPKLVKDEDAKALNEQVAAFDKLMSLLEVASGDEKKYAEALAQFGKLQLEAARATELRARIEEQLNPERQAARRAEEALAKATLESIAAYDKETDGLDKQAENLEKQSRALSMTQDELERYAVQQIDTALATAKFSLELQKQADGLSDSAAASAIEDRIRALERLKQATIDNANAKTSKAARDEIAKETERAAQQAQKEWERVNEEIERGLTDALLRGFESGKDFAENFRDTLKNMFNTLVLRPIIQAIVQPLAGSITDTLGITGRGGGVNNLLSGGGFNPLSLFNSGPNAGVQQFVYSSAGQALGLSGPATVANAAATSAEASLYGAAAAGTSEVVGASAAGSALISASAAMPYVAAAIAAAAAFGLFDKDPSEVKGQFRVSPDTTGFEDNAFTNSAFGNLGFSDENTQQFSGEAAQVFNKLVKGALDAFETRFSPEQSERLAGILQKTTFASAEGTFTTEEFIQKYGGDVLQQVVSAAFDVLDPALGAIARGFKGTADEIVKFGNTLLGIYDATQRINDVDFTATINTALESADQETADKVLAFVTIVEQFGTTIDGIADQFKNIDPENITKFIDKMGGAQQALASFQFFDENFTTNAERAERNVNNLSAAWDKAGRVAGLSQEDFEKAGIAGVKTHDDFVKLVDSLDLNTEHGRALRAVLMEDVAPAFVSVAGSAEQAAEKLKQEMAAMEQGLDAFHHSALFSASEQRQFDIAKDIKAFTDAEEKLGYSVPRTTQGFRNLVLDLEKTASGTGEAADAARAQLLILYDLTDEMVDYNGLLLKQASIIQNIDPFTGLNEALAFLDKVSNLAGESTGDFGEKLAIQIDLVKTEIDRLVAYRPSTYQGSFATDLTHAVDEEITELKKASSDFTNQLARFTILSAQYDADRAEQLVQLETWYEEQRKLFGGAQIDQEIDALKKQRDRYQALINSVNSGFVTASPSTIEAWKAQIAAINEQIADLDASGGPALQALRDIFQQKWDAIVNGAEEAAQKLEDFIQAIKQLADSTGGNAAQQARLEQTLVAARAAKLTTQLASLDPTSALAAQIQKELTSLDAYNAQLVTNIQHFAQYREQYGEQIANQLVDLENQFEAQKQAAIELGGTAETIAVLTEIFNDRFQEIANGMNDAGDAIDDFIARIKGIADQIGDAGQQARLEQALVASKLVALQQQLSTLDPASEAAAAVTADINRLQQYNEELATQLAHFAIYTAQYNRETADQLVELENWYNEQKKIIEANGGGADALAVLAEVFQEEWQKIIDSVSGSLSELERLRQGIADYLKGLQVSNLSPLTPQEQLAEARSALDAEIALAQQGDLKALGDVTQFLDRFLQINRDVNASNQQFTDDFEHYTELLGDLAGTQSNGMPITDATTLLAAAMPVNGTLVSSDDLQSGLATLANKLIEAIMALANANTEDAKEQTEELTRRLIAIEEEISAS